jgi:hypothetical protein
VWATVRRRAKRIAADLRVDDPYTVHDALKRRSPGVLLPDVRADEFSRDQLDDLCDAVESELRAPGEVLPTPPHSSPTD